jgi:protein-disulfide isomerase-like protein with CxxC motif
MKAQEMRPVPALIYNLWLFACHGFGIKYYCPTRARELSAEEIFSRRQTGVCYLEQALPSDPDLKWVELQCGRIFAEFSMVDFGMVDERIEEVKHRYPKLSRRGRQFLWDGESVVVSKTQQHFGKVQSPRTVLYNRIDLDKESLEPYLVIAELICDGGCFDQSLYGALHRIAQASGSGGMEMRQVQVLQQLQQRILVQEQRPLMIQTQRQVARRAQLSRVLRMSGAELRRVVHDANLELT